MDDRRAHGARCISSARCAGDANHHEVALATPGWVRDPGTPWGAVVFAPYARPRTRSASLYAFSQVTYDKFLKRLGAEIPERAELTFSRLNDFGIPGAGDIFKFLVDMDGPLDEEPPSVLRLIAHHPLTPPATDVHDEDAARWSDFALGFLAGLDVPVLYGHVANDVRVTEGGTTFEENSPGIALFDAFESGELRGYSWITIITAAQARHLGGDEALRSCGAFSSVEEVGADCLALRATDRLSDYTDEAVEKVWLSLAPLLPRGAVPRPGV